MYRIGLTGGVGSGKSTVSSYMKEFGIPVIDGDCLAMEAVAPGNIAMREIRQVFGNGIFNEDGSLNRLKTAEIIFKDEEKRKALNGTYSVSTTRITRSRRASSKVCTVIGNTAPCINTSRSSIEERYKVSAIALEELAPAFITDFELFLKTERTGF